MTFFRDPFPVLSPEFIRERNQQMADEDRKVWDVLDRILEPCSVCGLLISPDESRDPISKTHSTPDGCERDMVRGIMSL